MRSMWVVFSGTEESPVVTRVVRREHDLNILYLQDNEWIEEFEVEEKHDRKVRPSYNRKSME